MKTGNGHVRRVKHLAHHTDDVNQSTIRDIANHKQDENALQISEERYRLLFDSGNDAIFIHPIGPNGAPGKFTEVNDIACERLGYTRDEFLQMTPLELDDPAQSPRIGTIGSNLVANHHTTFETVHCAKNGKRIPVEINARQFALHGQSMVISIARDITLRKQVEETLRRSEERYRRIVETAMEGIWLMDLEGNTTFVNQRMADMLGYSAEEITRRSVFDFLDQTQHDQAHPSLTKRREGIGDIVERCFLRKDGSQLWVLNSASPVTDDAGQVVGSLDLLTDITERKRAEEALRDSERRFRTLTSMAPVGIYMTDAQGRYLYVNERWCEMAGMIPAQALGDGWLNGLMAGDRERIAATWNRTMESHGKWNTEYRFQNTQGAICWVAGYATEIRDTQDNLVGYIGTNIDITKRKKGEEEQRRRQQDLVALNSIATGISQARTLDEMLNTTLDVVLKLTRKKKGSIHLFGEYDRVLSLAIQHGFDPSLLKETEGLMTLQNQGVVTQAIQSGQTTVATGAILNSRRDPSDKSQHTQVAVPIKSLNHVLGVLYLVGYEGRTLDPQNLQLLTAIGNQLGAAIANKQLVEQMSQVQVWRETDRFRSELIANVSHELRTPLGVIKLFITALLDQGLSLNGETHQQFLRDISEQTTRLEHLVNDLLGASRQQSDRMHLNKQATDLVQLIQNVMKGTRVQLVQHQLVYDGPTTPLVLSVDPQSIDQVLRNLISNAIKYSPAGGTVAIHLIEEATQVLIRVDDEGIGIPPQDLERIFERFYRVENEVTLSAGGVGLGLALTRGNVAAHGGRIWAESTLGQGSRFFVSLPHPADPIAL